MHRVLNAPLAVLTGPAVAYIIALLLVLRLIASRFDRVRIEKDGGCGASWIPFFDAVASLALGLMSLTFFNPAGVPVIGMAFAAVGFLRESRESKRSFALILLALGTLLCGYATFISLSHARHE